MLFRFSSCVVLIYITITHVNCCVKIYEDTVHNCTNGQLYTRTPTEKNNYTSFWCIALSVSGNPYSYDNPDSFCKLRFGQTAGVSIPENGEELESIIDRFKTWMSRYNITTFVNWNAIVDGNLKPSCTPIGTCSPSASYETTYTQTDPTFIMNNWKDGQPDNSSFNGTQKTCLGIDNDGFLRNVFCDLASSPFNEADGNPEYNVYGLVCGLPANSYVLSGAE